MGGSTARAGAAPVGCGRSGLRGRQAMRLSGLRRTRAGVRQEGAHRQGLAGQGERGPGAAWLGRRPLRVLGLQRPELQAGVARGTAVACVLIHVLHANASPSRRVRAAMEMTDLAPTGVGLCAQYLELRIFAAASQSGQQQAPVAAHSIPT